MDQTSNSLNYAFYVMYTISAVVIWATLFERSIQARRLSLWSLVVLTSFLAIGWGIAEAGRR